MGGCTYMSIDLPDVISTDELKEMQNELFKLHGFVFGSDESLKLHILPVGIPPFDRVLGGGFAFGRIVEFIGAYSSGKGQPVDSKVLTPTGWRVIGELEPDDFVIGTDGQPTKVTGVYQRGRLPVYKVTFNDGTSLRVDGDHLWSVRTATDRSRGKGFNRVIETRTLRKLLNESKERNDGRYLYGTVHFDIPIVGPVQFDPKPLPVDPYVLGVLLGDGWLSTIGQCTTFTPGDEGTALEVERRLPEGCFLSSNPSRNRSKPYRIVTTRGQPNPVLTAMRSLGLEGIDTAERFIPPLYLLGSVEQRLDLLRGLLDTDGALSRGRVGFDSASFLLRDGVADLVQSLGGQARRTQRVGKLNGVAKRISYRLSIRMPSNLRPFLAREGTIKPTLPQRLIRSIEPDGEEEVVCISIDRPDGLYVTENYIVTHNTLLALLVIKAAQQRGISCAYLDVERTWNTDWARTLGVDVDSLLVLQPMAGEKAFDAAIDLCKRKVGVIVFDSIAEATPTKELEADSVGDQLPGLQARLVNRSLRVLGSYNESSLVIVINQLRESIGVMFGSNESIPGGKGQGYKMWQIVRVSRGAWKTEGEKRIGYDLKIGVIKSKQAQPQQEASVPFYFSGEIDEVGGLVSVALDLGIITKSGSYYQVNGLEGTIFGMPKLLKTVRESPELIERLRVEFNNVEKI